MPQPGPAPLGRESAAVPRHVVQSMLRKHLADPVASLTALSLQPFDNDGDSGNHTLLRAQLSWTCGQGSLAGTDEWIIKCWQPGGKSAEELGHASPVEALAWQYGLLAPALLPAGVVTPIVGSYLGASGDRA